MTRIVTVSNQKGGVGKTTTTVNMAAALAQAGFRILVIDLDPSRGSLAAVGQPGRIGLGRIGPGLEKWVRSTVNADR